MKFYAYIPREDGTEPMGTDHTTLFELKTIKGAIKRAGRSLNSLYFRLYTYQNFYDDKTFRLVYERSK